MFHLILFLIALLSPVAQTETMNALYKSAERQCVGNLVNLSANKWRKPVKEKEKTLIPVNHRLKPHSHKPRHITIHYSGVKAQPEDPLRKKLRGLFNYSINGTSELKKNLWGDIPYHFYLDANNQLGEGRAVDYQPDTNTNYNPDGHITIVVEGDNSDDLSPERKAKLFQMIEALQNKYNIPTAAVGGHSDHAHGTQCPGPAVGAALQEYKRLHRAYRPNLNACTRETEVAKWPATRPKTLAAETGSAEPYIDVNMLEFEDEAPVRAGR